MAGVAGRGALCLLRHYGSDSDGDSGYTSDDDRKRKSDHHSPHERKKKKRRHDDEEDMLVDTPPAHPHAHSQARPPHRQHHAHRSIPLPDDLLQGREEHTDDPTQHQGRARSFPHERGNWASILYIPLHLGVYQPSFTSLVRSLVSTCSQHNLSLTPSEDLHISLSRTLVLQLHWIHPITQELRRRLGQIPRFSMWLHGLSVYVNDERSRTFLGLRVCQGRTELDELVAEADKCWDEYRLPPFYKDGSYHASIAWCVGDVSEPLRRLLPQLENLCSQYFAVETDMRTFDVPALLFKTGNRVHTVHLRSQEN